MGTGVMERASIIIPTFNRAGYLAACLDAVLAQTLPPGEILVVDDGSTDGTESVVRSFGARVRYVRQENSGKAAALNLGLERTSHPLVWIVDDDDIVCSDALERLTALLAENPRAGFAYGRHLRFEEDAAGSGRHILPTGYWRSCAPEEVLVSTLEDFFAHQPGMLVRRSLYERVGPFDPTLVRSQDYDMLIRLARAGVCAPTEAVVFFQRQHAGRRGSGQHRFDARESARKWIEADQRIFRSLHGEMALGEYLPGSAQNLDEAARRRALLQRGVVMARKKLWSLAVADFNEAAQIDCGSLRSCEVAILRRAFSSKFGCDEVVSDAGVRVALSALDPEAPYGRPIRAALAAGLKWRIREAGASARFARAARLVALLLALKAGRL